MIISKDIENQIKSLLAQNRKLEAVKLVCDTTKCGLLAGKNFVDSFDPVFIQPSAEAPVSSLDMDHQILALLAKGKKLEAVKLYKNVSHLGLAECKNYVEALQESRINYSLGKTASPLSKRETDLYNMMKEQGLKPGKKIILSSSTSGEFPLKFLLRFFGMVLITCVAFYCAYLLLNLL